MAEFCVECWNRIMGSCDSPKKYVLSRELDLCEECGKRKPVIVRVKRRYLLAELFLAWKERLKNGHELRGQ